MEQVLVSVISIRICIFKRLDIQGYDVFCTMSKNQKKLGEKKTLTSINTHFHPEQLGFLMLLEV